MTFPPKHGRPRPCQPRSRTHRSSSPRSCVTTRVVGPESQRLKRPPVWTRGGDTCTGRGSLASGTPRGRGARPRIVRPGRWPARSRSIPRTCTPPGPSTAPVGTVPTPPVWPDCPCVSTESLVSREPLGLGPTRTAGHGGGAETEFPSEAPAMLSPAGPWAVWRLDSLAGCAVRLLGQVCEGLATSTAAPSPAPWLGSRVGHLTTLPLSSKRPEDGASLGRGARKQDMPPGRMLLKGTS